jgi:aspartate aminotransferase, cytoplasmic
VTVPQSNTDNGNPWVLPVVKKAELMIVQDATLDHEYSNIDGIASFTAASIKLMLGDNSSAILSKRVASAQTISGTGACRLGADFLARFAKAPVYIPNPTWGNHTSIFADAGFTDIRQYTYWDPNTRGLNFAGVMESFKNAPEKSILLLHPCAHNPTGVDPTMEQWKEIAQVAKDRKLIVFFDSAYQGFASGSLEKDSHAVRHFVESGIEVLIAQSYSKNFGLYNERCGCLSVVTSSPQKAVEVSSQLCKLIRACYSNPPAFGARIVSLVLNTPALYAEW